MDSRTAQILIVDDDHQLRQSFERLLAAEGYAVRTASSGEAGILAVREAVPDLVVMDVRMPGISGLEAYAAMREFEPRLPVIIMTAFGTTDIAIEATKMGAYDYILKPFDIPEILKLIEKAVAAGRSMRSRVAVGEEGEAAVAADAIIGRSQAMQDLYKAIGRAAPTDATVLIRGESGTGKELVARAVYQHSLRADKPFLVINCVAIPETLLESELFGYEKGAFTGATGRKVGKIEQANRGTVFLDEIGDMPLSIQAKILRLLQEQNVERLGGRQVIPVDVRIIAATNRDLEAAVRAGQFREDLYYRLKVVTMAMPPLRERPGDIPLLVRYFLARYSREMGQPDPGVSDEAMALLTTQPWPGNVRELGNTVKKALIFNLGAPLGPDEVQKASGEPLRGGGPAEADPGDSLARYVRRELASGRESLFEDLMDRFGLLVIREALEATGGNRSQAARLLGLSRPTLLAKIEKYGLRIESRVRQSDS
ncbi:two component, sigma54 specific, transcriptional regulator, Fis family [Solidesulfovibrio carbinoliphilus subsp. oakridgensis]|uniref:DNA-binding transcriptional regulator NtrC n=1 Tax=Solidesulfovibrio carbinoliphilus subsp. oakridgensis TaxID=694327 RepID=G7Q5P9_9BACT|nr:sigma-54 dependent transcriptional regulator [Solidesulfovibrio carbinoliphilus]EHJ49608.1 two component, sigma54 specific, transcriptional regulator, Fis family [Solidesulfovibrio carbinoliphilus subsp. oakridgensis]